MTKNIVILIAIIFITSGIYMGLIVRPSEKIIIPTPIEATEEKPQDIFKNQTVDLVNIERERKNLPPLKRNILLDRSAQMKANDLAEKHYWSHTDLDGNMSWGLFDKVGYNYSYAGENLARKYLTPKEVVGAWMLSQKHKDNILSPNFTEIGVGYSEDEGIIIVQHFGKPDDNK